MILLEIFLTFDGILKEFILCTFIIWIVCYIIYSLIQEAYNKIFKKNCLLCKHCYLADVASCGDGCRYKCMKHKYEALNQRMISSNCRTLYKKCNDYERKP